MKGVVLFLLLLTLPLAAQEMETLIGGRIESGGYGGPMLSFSSINGESAVLVGGRGGWIINHQFVLGGGGYAVASNHRAALQSADGEELYIEAGFGGLMLEYYHRPAHLLHFALHAFIGGGTVTYSERNEKDDGGEGEKFDMDSFFYLEPGVTLTLNVTSFMRFGAGVSYRYVNGVSLAPLTDSDLSAPAFNLFLNFGSF